MLGLFSNLHGNRYSDFYNLAINHRIIKFLLHVLKTHLKKKLPAMVLFVSYRL